MKNISIITRRRFHVCLVYICLMIGLSEASKNAYGVLAAESPSEDEKFCIIYFQEFALLPQEADAKSHALDDASELDWCEEHPDVDSSNKVLLLTKNNCSISTQARNVRDSHGEAALFIAPTGRVGSFDINATAAASVNISVGLISNVSVEYIKNMNSSTTVRLFAPFSRKFDLSLLVIWVIAMITITIGSYWSGHLRYAIFCEEVGVLPGADKALPNKPCVKTNTVEDSSLSVSPWAVAFFVGCMGAMLLLLYFFFDYLVYFIIGLFVLACILAVYTCLEPLVLKIPGAYWKVSQVCGRILSHKVDIRLVCLFSFATAISLYWLIIRKQKYAWILQDTLGVFFCIHMLKSIRLPSLKICTVLLVLLFFYDIFFVFVTPFFTVKGESVMEQVATGSKSNEMLPMVINVVHLEFDPLNVCPKPFSILGFGDILVPGLLISYCKGFDLATRQRSLYFPVTVAAFGVGLLVTFAGLFLMSTAQPALLYLVPFTLIPPIIIGWARGEFSALWTGFRTNPKVFQLPPDTRTCIHGTCPLHMADSHSTCVDAPSVLDSPAVNIAGDGVNPSSEATHEPVGGERKHLLR